MKLIFSLAISLALLALVTALLTFRYFHIPLSSSQQSALYTTAYDISPDGKQIVFAGKGSGGTDLYLFDLVTHQVKRLTDTPGYENDPAFSPDGKSIVYQYARDLASPRYLFLRSLDGRHVRQLTRGTPTSDSSPSFSWSGAKIVFCRSHKFLNNDAGSNNWDQQDVYTINRNGTGLLRLTRGNYELMIRPCFYPGDKNVLFETLHINNYVGPEGVGMQGSLARVSTSGIGPTIALKCPTVDGDMYGWPSFTTDGKQIIYNINNNGAISIYRAAPDGTQSHTIKVGGAFFNAKMTSDGKHIYYMDRDDMNLWEMDAKGGNAHRITVVN